MNHNIHKHRVQGNRKNVLLSACKLIQQNYISVILIIVLWLFITITIISNVYMISSKFDLTLQINRYNDITSATIENTDLLKQNYSILKRDVAELEEIVEDKRKYIIYQKGKIKHYNETYYNLYNKFKSSKTKFLELKASADKALIKYNNTFDEFIEQLIQLNQKGDSSIETILNNIETFTLQKNSYIRSIQEEQTIPITMFLHSDIIKTRDDYDIITKMITTERRIQLIPLYKATKHGSSSFDFMNKVGKYSPTVSLIMDLEGNVFGGFTYATWDITKKNISDDKSGLVEEYKEDNKAFIFSMNKNKKYVVNTPNKAIYVSNESVCSFGYGKDIYVSSEFLVKDVPNYVMFPTGYGNFKDKANEVSGFNKIFDVKEIEVYYVREYQ